MRVFFSASKVVSVVAALAMLGGSGLLQPTPVSAQPRGSERSTVSQLINGTTITLDFSRPVARGRDNIFGGVVHWNEVWTPGANWATTLEVDRPIMLEGRRVEPGRYSVWLQPREGASWRLSLNREWRLYHDAPVPDDGFFLEVDVMPEQGGHMEALNWYVHSLDSRGGTLRVHWGPTYVPIDIQTEALTWEPMAAADRAALVGSFAFDTQDPTTGGPMALTISVLEENGTLVGRWGSAPIALIPAGAGEFNMGFLRDGELFDVAGEMSLRVLSRGGVSTEAQLLWEGEVFGVGRKVR